MKCEECDEDLSTVRCADCEQFLCPSCDEKLHRKGKRQTHQRAPLCSSCGAAPGLICPTCAAIVCLSCKGSAHEGHGLSDASLSHKAAVFWDVVTAKVEDEEEVRRVVGLLRKRYGADVAIRAYGETDRGVGETMSDLGVVRVVKPGLKEGETMLLELPTIPKDVSDILVISGLAYNNRNLYQELAASMPGVSLLVSSTCLPLAPKNPDELTPPTEPRRSQIRNVSTDLQAGVQVVVVEVVPLYQRFPRKPGHEEIHDTLLSLFRSLAYEGSLMPELPSLVASLQSSALLIPDQAQAVIRSSESLGLVHFIQRQFGAVKNSVMLCGMKLDGMSLEALTWILRSLKRDEMIPTERAIQSRIKEAFDYKPTPTQWTHLLEAARGRVFEGGHHHSSSVPNEKHLSLFSLSLQPDPYRAIPTFTVEEMNDPITGQETCVVYPKDETWVPLDQHTKTGDVLGAKLTPEWQIFTQFLENYFIGDRMGKKRSWKSQDTESKAIPGGRYGCAQFLKTCGPSQLQQCSLGRLSYMVQVAINEDLLRYQRTLLVWTETSQKRTADDENSAKLKNIQRAIIRVLGESKGGVSLAQLPQYVKKYAQIDLNELGFAKLKDLLATMTEVKIELRGTNHPFAMLKQQQNFEKELEDVLGCIADLSRESPNGVPLESLDRLTELRLGRAVNWEKLGCRNVMEFVRKWGKSLFYIVRTSADSFVLKSSGDSTPLSLSREFMPEANRGFHTHSQSVNLGGGVHFHQHSGSMFYSLNPLEKVVKTSDLPTEFLISPKLSCAVSYSSSQSDFEAPKYLPRAASEEDTSISTALHGNDPPHYRTESVEYHSNHPSIGRHEWKKLAQMIQNEPIFHVKAASEDLESEDLQGEGKDGMETYVPVYHVDPPPGFEGR